MRYGIELLRESGTWWLGEDFWYKIGSDLPTDVDWYKDYLNYLTTYDPNHAEIFQQTIQKLVSTNRGISPIEIIPRRLEFNDDVAHFTDAKRRIIPLNVYDIGAKKPPDNYKPVVRVSALAQIDPTDRCILHPYLFEKGKVEIDDKINLLITKGNLVHEFSLTDPFKIENGQRIPYADFLNYYFLDELEPQRRENYCEKPFIFNLDGVEVHATPDSSFLIEETPVVVNVDLKFSHVPPSMNMHRRYVWSMCGYYLGYRSLGLERSIGVIGYLRPLQQEFIIVSKEFDRWIEQETRNFLLRMGEWYPQFEENPENILEYASRHLSKKPSCKTCRKTLGLEVEGLEEAD